MSITTIITVTIIANNFTIIYSPCSVPYRGYSFFNRYMAYIEKTIIAGFPSLTGVIHFLIAGIRAIKTVAQTFPSLTGVIHFLICYRLQS